MFQQAVARGLGSIRRGCPIGCPGAGWARFGVDRLDIADIGASDGRGHRNIREAESINAARRRSGRGRQRAVYLRGICMTHRYIAHNTNRPERWPGHIHRKGRVRGPPAGCPAQGSSRTRNPTARHLPRPAQKSGQTTIAARMKPTSPGAGNKTDGDRRRHRGLPYPAQESRRTATTDGVGPAVPGAGIKPDRPEPGTAGPPHHTDPARRSRVGSTVGSETPGSRRSARHGGPLPGKPDNLENPVNQRGVSGLWRRRSPTPTGHPAPGSQSPPAP
ncbi:hypothetical protein SAMN04489832_1206 [Micromonospora cremea]|uniref:Uncharacterized protein n=1 Tax=Micromonospora cremea TaxID=709881 RepID=A0A1N5UYQ6_9ACTN|nr:hypothetical protein SAMN04489832_1206 [Micromonospora cremea]